MHTPVGLYHLLPRILVPVFITLCTLRRYAKQVCCAAAIAAPVHISDFDICTKSQDHRKFFYRKDRKNEMLIMKV